MKVFLEYLKRYVNVSAGEEAILVSKLKH